MLIRENRLTTLTVTLLFLGAVLLPCLSYAQGAMDGMHAVMPIGGMQQKCCAIQIAPNFHAVLQATAAHDAYRGTLLLVAFLAVVATAVLRARREDPGNVLAVRELALRQAQRPLSGFERFLQRGAAQPRLFELAVVLN